MINTTQKPEYFIFSSLDIDELHKIRRSCIGKLAGILKHHSYDHYNSRIKTNNSIGEKLVKKGLEPTKEQAFAHLTDIIGIRIVTQYLTDVYSLIDHLHQIFDVVSEQDYITHPKESGYRSYHLIINFPVNNGRYALQNHSTIPIEIQVRTMGMDFWASLEHSLIYKNNKSQLIEKPKNMQERNSALIQNELRNYAEDIFSIDMRLQALQKLMEYPKKQDSN